MSNIEELQRRITTAMDRVAQGLEQLGTATTGPDPAMTQALEDERTANAQLNERLRSLRSKYEAENGTLSSQIEEAQTRIAQLDIELQRLRRANQELTSACAALSEANAEGVGDAHLINRAMLAELEGLRAARAADIAESSAILSALTPLVNGAGTASEENS
jgi:predicted RNase H-like nuclease (RuvC/YqgF family)